MTATERCWQSALLLNGYSFSKPDKTDGKAELVSDGLAEILGMDREEIYKK